jgi:hypothetical protein
MIKKGNKIGENRHIASQLRVFPSPYDGRAAVLAEPDLFPVKG